MDAAERHFGITIEFEDFLQVHTVKDIAQRISALVARHGAAGLPTAAPSTDPGAAQARTPAPAPEEARLKRVLFHLAPVEPAASTPIELHPGESVLLLAPDQHDEMAKRAGDLLQRAYGMDTLAMPFLSDRSDPGAAGLDLLTSQGAAKASERIAENQRLAGMLITLPHGGSGKLQSTADVSRLLKGLFPLLKAFLQAPTRKFVVLLHSRAEADTLSGLLAEGLLGLFLSAAQEYPAVQFRTLEVDRDTDLQSALRAALDRGFGVVELLHRDGKLLTSEGYLASSVFKDPPSLNLSPGDVVVMSGGATGISAHLARSLAPFSLRLVFLGRTSLDSRVEPAKPHATASSSQSGPVESRVREIARTLAELRASGIEATYQTCDVTDPAAVRAVLGAVVSRYGRIDGIIHGAGILRDGLLDQMSPADFALVADVKFLGAWNLFSAAQGGGGLRFFVGLSSVAAIQGNPGQANYAAANRMMSALLRDLARRHGAIRFKALMLPPIEGAGMADNPELRGLLKRKGVAYIHAQELAGLFCRELFVAPADDHCVLFMRTLPTVRMTRLGDMARPTLKGELDAGTVAFSHADFPMIDEIASLDLRQEQVEVSRTFSQQNDLWIADHRPLNSVAHPLVSATMMIETLMENARVLYPHLRVRGVRQVRFRDMIPCPPGVLRLSRTSCRRADAGLREVVCDVSLALQDLSPTGRRTDHFTPHCTGQVLLGAGEDDLGKEFQSFPVRPDELRAGSVDQKKMLDWYKNRTGLNGRYRVLEAIEGTGPGVVRGRTTYRPSSDFAHLPAARYQYSPYLFEALLQLVGFTMVMTDLPNQRPVLPVEIGEMHFLRLCQAGERVTLEARLRERDQASLAWDARGIDEQGRTIMQVRTMRMQWVSE
jgi:NAD(P)-dependent dehydrogenase (short-subunit alcohol dehydrogenase family)